MNQNSLLKIAEFSPKSLQSPNAWVGHLPFATWAIKEVSPKIFVELGTHSGNSYFSFCQSILENSLSTKCYAVDTWLGDEHAGRYNEDIFANVSAHNQEHYAGFSRLLRMTFDDAVTYFADGSIDLLHIDGLHSYEAVRHDFETWLPKLASGAVVMFHDTNVRERDFGVWKLWAELQALYPNNLEFVHCNGLGVLQLNHETDKRALEWIQQASPEKNRLIDYFSALGSGQLTKFDLKELKQYTENLAQVIVERDEQMGIFKHAITASEQKIEGLNLALDQANAHIQRIEKSLSRTIIKNIRCYMQLIKHYIQHLKHSFFILARRSKNYLNVVVRRPFRFKPEVYLKLNPDIAEAGVDPLQHYLDHRIHEGRSYSKLKEKLEGLSTLKQLFFKFKKKNIKTISKNLLELPIGFKPEVYLKLNADIAEAGIDPLQHYLDHGIHEGRSYSVNVTEIDGNYKINPNLETMLLVSHEASWTGAPILTLNIAKSFVQRYNIVVLLLGDGSLIQSFQHTSIAVILAPTLRGNSVHADFVINLISDKFSFKFCLVNSIESRSVLLPLSRHFIPTISLIHEFSSCYPNPQKVLSEASIWSTDMVFSSKLILDDAITDYIYLKFRSTHIIPQGRCILPLEGLEDDELKVERDDISQLVRPLNIAENSLVILGVGSVHLRKGVDLFIQCAAYVVNTLGCNKCRFVWVGKGYDPKNDGTYSVYLLDQIHRAKLDEHVFFIDETAVIEAAYEHADVLLLSSRLDPLPNVAIDAMAFGLPVLCFDKATGIADILKSIGLGDQCVAEYMNIDDIAKKIIAFVHSRQLLLQVGNICREASVKLFNMEDYVSSLEMLVPRICDISKQEKIDTELIQRSGLFRSDFSSSNSQQNQSIEDQIRFYVRAWANEIGCKKPFPGFHPGIYLEQHGVAIEHTDPFADYLRAGQPVGPWCYEVIESEKKVGLKLPLSQRVALHLHVYYPELLRDITTRLSINQISPDLFISINNEDSREFVMSELKEYKGRIVDIQLVPNRGRDIGPFLTLFGPHLVINYDFIGHIHTKMSADIKDHYVGKVWYKFLLENLLGGDAGSMADIIIDKMNSDKTIGIVFPDDPYVVGMSAKLPFADMFAERLGLEKFPEHFIFPVGTMFWARPSALAPLINLKLEWDDYPKEPLPYDGTLLHAIERLFALSLNTVNLRSVVTNVVGVTR